MKSLLVVCLVVASFTLCGCFDIDLAAWFFSEDLTSADIPGRYLVWDDEVVDILQLNPDGTFTQYMITGPSDTILSGGHWEFFEREPMDFRLELSSYRIQLPDWREEMRRIPIADTGVIDRSCIIEKVLGKTRLWIDYELMFMYRKVKHETDDTTMSID